MSNCSKILTTTIAIVACLLFAPLKAEAQQAEKVWRIGYLTPASYIWPTFSEGLGELGYVEGKNLAIEFRQRKWPKTYLALA